MGSVRGVYSLFCFLLPYACVFILDRFSSVGSPMCSIQFSGLVWHIASG
jgi:hypothetical protein